eukprot:3910113-Alexandrium_andersonii.AAC.1
MARMHAWQMSTRTRPECAVLARTCHAHVCEHPLHECGRCAASLRTGLRPSTHERTENFNKHFSCVVFERAGDGGPAVAC